MTEPHYRPYIPSPDYPYSIWSEPYPGSGPEVLDSQGMHFVGEYSDPYRAQAEALRMAYRTGLLHVVRDPDNLTLSLHHPPGRTPL